MSAPRAARAAALLLLGAGSLPALAAGPSIPNDKVEMQGLDKVTARVVRFEVARGQPVQFGTLRIQLDACFTSPPTEQPEAAAFLQIDDLDQDREERIFSGWMYASSPSLHALEHPVYDVWVIGCSAPLDVPPGAPELSNPVPGAG